MYHNVDGPSITITVVLKNWTPYLKKGVGAMRGVGFEKNKWLNSYRDCAGIPEHAVCARGRFVFLFSSDGSGAQRPVDLCVSWEFEGGGAWDSPHRSALNNIVT